MLPLQQTDYREVSWSEHKARIEGFHDNLPEVALRYIDHLDWKGSGQTKYLAASTKRKGFHWMPVETALLHQFFMPNKGALPKLWIWDVDLPKCDVEGWKQLPNAVCKVVNRDNGNFHVHWAITYTREELYDRRGTKKRLKRALNSFKFLGYCDPGYQLTGTRSPLWCLGSHYKTGPRKQDFYTFEGAQWHHDVEWFDWATVSVDDICGVAERLLGAREEELQNFIRGIHISSKAIDRAISIDAKWKGMTVDAFKTKYGIVTDDDVGYDVETGNVIRLRSSPSCNTLSEHESATNSEHGPSRNRDTFDWARIKSYACYRPGMTEDELLGRTLGLCDLAPFGADKWDLPCIARSITNYILNSDDDLAVKIRSGQFVANDPYAPLRPYRHVGPTAEEKAKEAGISRRTWFRRKEGLYNSLSDYESANLKTNTLEHGGNRTGSGRQKSYTDAQAKDVVNYKRLGWTVTRIMEVTGLNRNVVNRILKGAKS